jgi:hypothetical protein
MTFKAGDVFDGSRALLNDQNGQLFTDAIQKEYFKLAFESLRLRCEENQIPFVLTTTSTAISVPQGTTDIGGPTGPALPRDLIEVLDCWEIPAGTTNDYMLMRHMKFLPKTSILTAYLEVWTWQNEYIHLLGANGDISVKLDYIGSNFGDVTDANQVIRLTNSINYLKFYTAALIAQFIGENEDRAKTLSNLADDAMDTMLNIKIMSQQNMNTRRRPFMGSYKIRSGGSYR